MRRKQGKPASDIGRFPLKFHQFAQIVDAYLLTLLSLL